MYSCFCISKIGLLPINGKKYSSNVLLILASVLASILCFLTSSHRFKTTSKVFSSFCISALVAFFASLLLAMGSIPYDNIV
jgi:hypothetical protein